jgi:hypothetical protein
MNEAWVAFRSKWISGVGSRIGVSKLSASAQVTVMRMRLPLWNSFEIGCVHEENRQGVVGQDSFARREQDFIGQLCPVRERQIVGAAHVAVVGRFGVALILAEPRYLCYVFHLLIPFCSKSA